MRQWPIEGREGELAAVKAAFAGSAVNAVLVLAEAGVGKTRLAREALDRLGCRTEWIAASQAASAIPFGALAHLLPDDVRSPAGPAGLIKLVCSRAASWGGRSRVAIGVDDAHLLDDGSSTVVANLIAVGAAFVVLTARTAEPLADCLARLGREGDATVLALSPLPVEAIDRLIDHSTGGMIEVGERRRLHAAAQGNPLALRELLYGAVPGGLTDLVTSRLDSLDSGTRHVVEMVACGEPVPLGFLERVAGSAAVVAAEGSGLVVCERSGARTQARLDHPLFGEVLRARMGVARSRQIYRELAGQLLGTPMRRREDSLRGALWQVEGGQITRPDLVREGARQAVGRSGLMLAERLARAARAAEPGAEADWLLAEILEYQGRSGEAAELLPATPPQRLTERIHWAVARADWLYWACGDLGAAVQALDTAAGHPTIEGARAFILFFAGRCVEAAHVAGGVLDSDEPDPQGMVWAAAAGTASLGFLGRIEQAQAVRARGGEIAAAHAGALPWAAFQIEVGACLAHLACGYPQRAAQIAANGYQNAVQDGAPMMVSGWALYGGMAAAAQGHLDHAGRLLTEALAGFERNDTFRLRRSCLAAQAWVCALRGQDQPASELMDRVEALDNGTNHVLAPWITTWRAWVTQSRGDAATAVEQATRAADLAAAADMPGVEAMARYDVIRLGGVGGSPLGGIGGSPLHGIGGSPPCGTTGLTRLAGLPGHLPAVLGAAARALTDADGLALTRAAETLAGLGYYLHAAELAMAAVRALRNTGHRGQAGLAAASAAALCAECPGASTPLLAPEDLGTVLSPRERQIVLLATRQTSVQIARQLGLAVSTVNNNLARAYTKLGITGRAQLRALLGPADSQEPEPRGRPSSPETHHGTPT